MTLSTEALRWDYVKRLAPFIRRSDVVECAVNGNTPEESMLWALEAGRGRSWVVLDEGCPIGAYGWTQHGAIWSLWADLLPDQAKDVARNTAGYIRAVVANWERSGQMPQFNVPLRNAVWEDNRHALAWLRASHCFNIKVDEPILIGHRRFIPFETKTLGELANV